MFVVSISWGFPLVHYQGHGQCRISFRLATTDAIKKAGAAGNCIFASLTGNRQPLSANPTRPHHQGCRDRFRSSAEQRTEGPRNPATGISASTDEGWRCPSRYLHSQHLLAGDAPSGRRTTSAWNLCRDHLSARHYCSKGCMGKGPALWRSHQTADGCECSRWGCGIGHLALHKIAITRHCSCFLG